ncbi:MAG: hypothetical protein GXP38_01225 [Chloroflexi bacterium]|nr:hypothetical protein [Chloroflexota bacterium]
MKHRPIVEQIAVYAYLSPSARRAVDDHIESCASCAREMQNVRETAQRLRMLPSPPPPPHLRENFLRVLTTANTSAKKEGRQDRRGWLQPLVSWGAVVGLLLLLALSLRLEQRAVQPGTTVLTPTPQTTPHPYDMRNVFPVAEQMDENLNELMDIPRAEMKEIPVTFDMAQCRYVPQNWNQENLITVTLDKIMLGQKTGIAGAAGVIEGSYRIAAGTFWLHIGTVSNGTVTIYEKDGEIVLGPGAGTFHLHTVWAAASDSWQFGQLTLDIQDLEGSGYSASCNIQLPTDSSQATSLPLPAGERVLNLTSEQAMAYAPAVSRWIAAHTWFTLPTSVPWDYSRPYGFTMGQSIEKAIQGVAHFNLIGGKEVVILWRQGRPEGRDDATQFPQAFFQWVTTPNFGNYAMSGAFEYRGQCLVDGHVCREWALHLQGRPDRIWRVWYDAAADLSYAIVLPGDLPLVLSAFAREFHAENPNALPPREIWRRSVVDWQNLDDYKDWPWLLPLIPPHSGSK